MRIEAATMDDLDRIVDLWVALAAEQRAHGSHLLAEPNRDPIRLTIGTGIVDDRVVVAREDAIVGFVQFEVEGGTFARSVTRGLIQNVYVEPRARGEGIGSALLDAAERRLAATGVDVIALEAIAANDGARRLYRRRGYRPHRIEYERPARNDTHSREGR